MTAHVPASAVLTSPKPLDDTPCDELLAEPRPEEAPCPRPLRVPFARVTMVRGAGRLAWLVAGAAALAVPGQARAASYSIQSDSTFQAYDVTSPWGGVYLARRRLTETLALGVYDLQGDAGPSSARYAVVLRLRFDGDYGVSSLVGGSAETNYASFGGGYYVPGLESAPLDLMYGYVEGRGFADGRVDVRIGRQNLSDMLGWWGFDGALVRVTTPLYLRAEIYGGMEQRGGLFLSTSRYEAPGMWRGSHAGYGTPGYPRASDYPSYQAASPAPAFGGALETVGIEWARLRLGYRRVYNTGEVMTAQFPSASGQYPTLDGLRISQDRVGASGEIFLAKLGRAQGSASYDLYSQRVASYNAGVEGYVGERVTLGADLDSYVPTFDADSIWNFFTHGPITTATGRVTAKLTPKADIAASGGVRIWTMEGDPQALGEAEVAACKAAMPESACQWLDPSEGAVKAASRDSAVRGPARTADLIAQASARYRFRLGDVGANVSVQAGDSGHTDGGRLWASRRLDGGRYEVRGSVSLYDWADPDRPSRDATSFGYVLGFGYTPSPIAKLGLEWEHDVNRLIGQRFRVLGRVQIAVMQ